MVLKGQAWPFLDPLWTPKSENNSKMGHAQNTTKSAYGKEAQNRHHQSKESYWKITENLQGRIKVLIGHGHFLVFVEQKKI